MKFYESEQCYLTLLIKKGLIEEYLRTILEPWRSTQEAEGVALEMR